MLKKIWKDPVGSKLIAAALLTIIPSMIAYSLGAWPIIWAALVSLVKFFGQKSDVPNWLIGFLIIPLVLVLWELILSFNNQLKYKEKKQFSEYDYTNDSFLGLDWHWSYDRHGLTITGCLCIECQFRIRPSQSGDYYVSPHRCDFSCQNCGYTARPFEGSYKELEDHITSKVEHQIRTGAWKQKVIKGKGSTSS